MLLSGKKKNRISDFVEAGTESSKYQDEIRRFLHFAPFPQPSFACKGTERLWQPQHLTKIKRMALKFIV